MLMFLESKTYYVKSQGLLLITLLNLFFYFQTRSHQSHILRITLHTSLQPRVRLRVSFFLNIDNITDHTPMYHKEPSYHFHLFHQVMEPSEYPWEVHPIEGWPQDCVVSETA